MNAATEPPLSPLEALAEIARTLGHAHRLALLEHIAQGERAVERLAELIRSAGKTEKARRPTKPTLGSKKRRLDGKSRRATVKAGRGKVDY